MGQTFAWVDDPASCNNAPTPHIMAHMPSPTRQQNQQQPSSSRFVSPIVLDQKSLEKQTEANWKSKKRELNIIRCRQARENMLKPGSRRQEPHSDSDFSSRLTDQPNDSLSECTPSTDEEFDNSIRDSRSAGERSGTSSVHGTATTVYSPSDSSFSTIPTPGESVQASADTQRLRTASNSSNASTCNPDISDVSSGSRLSKRSKVAKAVIPPVNVIPPTFEIAYLHESRDHDQPRSKDGGKVLIRTAVLQVLRRSNSTPNMGVSYEHWIAPVQRQESQVTAKVITPPQSSALSAVDNESHSTQDNESHSGSHSAQDNESHSAQDNESHSAQDNESHSAQDNESQQSLDTGDIDTPPVLKSIGSAGHPDRCRECQFFLFSLMGCKKGEDCQYCHEFHPRVKERKNYKLRRRLAEVGNLEARLASLKKQEKLRTENAPSCNASSVDSSWLEGDIC